MLTVAFLGCNATGGDPTDGGGMDGGLPEDAGSNLPMCSMTEGCTTGFVCAAVEGVPRCVPDPDPPPPGDGTDCRPCPAPGECRNSICIQPTESGAFCEFDSECGDGQLCIAGRCTPDPRVPTPCTTDADCYAGLTCSANMVCVCSYATDCPIGLICEETQCVPPPGSGTSCVADAECPATEVCDRGICRNGTVCDIGHDNYAGTWNMQSELNVRESLPDWLDNFLEAVEGPFRFIAGDAACFDFGLPDWVENEICDLVRPLIEQYIPQWSQPLFRAIADLNQVLGTWEVEETMVLEGGAVTDSYRGTHTWNRLTFYYRSMPLSARPSTIRNWQFSPSPFNASAVCGTFHIERHDVHVSIGAVFAWVVDALVYAITETEYDSLGEAVAGAASGFCRALGDFAEDNVDYNNVGTTVFNICTQQIEQLTNAALRELLMARVGTSPITLRGQAPITGPNSFRTGTWDGTLLGREFSGAWQADR